MTPGAASTNSRPEATAICEAAMLGRIGTMQHAVAEFGQVCDLTRAMLENAARAAGGNGCEAASSADICGSVSAIGDG